jgi:hypothetical protein
MPSAVALYVNHAGPVSCSWQMPLKSSGKIYLQNPSNGGLARAFGGRLQAAITLTNGARVRECHGGVHSQGGSRVSREVAEGTIVCGARGWQNRSSSAPNLPRGRFWASRNWNHHRAYCCLLSSAYIVQESTLPVMMLLLAPQESVGTLKHIFIEREYHSPTGFYFRRGVVAD